MEVPMEWDVLLDGEFADWLGSLNEAVRIEILAAAGLLRV
jgi:hypothetical protein